MLKRLIGAAAVAVAAALAAPSVHAAAFHFTGNIQYHNDVVYVPFTLDADATNVRVWTDSFMNGLNFDPITALWKADGTFLMEDDDNASVNPATQTTFDSGFTLASLAAGSYIFTVAAFNNWHVGNLLSDGFSFDNQTPFALEQWCQPASNCNMGKNWSIRLDGVSDATNPGGSVPEPGTALLVLGALAGLGALRRRAVY